MKMTENHLYYEIWFYFKCVPIFRLKKSDLKCLIGLIKCLIVKLQKCCGTLMENVTVNQH